MKLKRKITGKLKLKLKNKSKRKSHCHSKSVASDVISPWNVVCARNSTRSSCRCPTLLVSRLERQMLQMWHSRQVIQSWLVWAVIALCLSRLHTQVSVTLLLYCGILLSTQFVRLHTNPGKSLNSKLNYIIYPGLECHGKRPWPCKSLEMWWNVIERVP